MLGLTGGGSGLPYIRFSPQANAWTNKEGQEIQLKQLVFDIDATQTGWLMLATGVRDWQPDHELGKKGAQPSADHKRGFVARFYNKELGLVEWSSNQAGSNMGFESLYMACSKDRAANLDKVPVVEYQGADLLKVGKGGTRKPKFVLVKWIPRPAGMDGEAEAPVAAVQQAVPAQRDEEF